MTVIYFHAFLSVNSHTSYLLTSNMYQTPDPLLNMIKLYTNPEIIYLLSETLKNSEDLMSFTFYWYKGKKYLESNFCGFCLSIIHQAAANSQIHRKAA